MDFFAQQHHARQATGRLLLLFPFAVILVFIGINSLLYVFAVLTTYDHGKGTWWWHAWSLQALLGTLLLVVGGAWLEWFALRSGGVAVAQMLGARAVDFATRDLAERQLRHVAEEMSIAAGIPTPSLYVLDDEHGLNAFVAGYSPQQSVLVVTQGLLRHLNRDELQAVIGHEYSHILNGDMRLNMRLLAVLAGLLAVGQVGGFLWRMSRHRRQSRDKERYMIEPFFGLLGAGMWLVGAFALGVGRLVRAAVTRQREFLADAASVQFTRNPQALASALYKLKTLGSALNNLHAEELSPFCFGLSLPWQRWLSTHPPLDERIQRIAPDFLVRQKYRSALPVTHEPSPVEHSNEVVMALQQVSAVAKVPVAAIPRPQVVITPEQTVAFITPPQQLIARCGELHAEDLLAAQQLLQYLPVEVSRALQTGVGARAVLLALLMGADNSLRLDANLYRWVQQLQQQLSHVDGRWSLSIAELTFPRLLMLDETVWCELKRQIRQLIHLQSSVLAVVVLILLQQQRQPEPILFRQVDLTGVKNAVSQLVACLLAYSSHKPEQHPVVYQQLLATQLAQVPAWPIADQHLLGNLERVFRQLGYLRPDAKRKLLKLCADTVQSDGVLHIEEYELVRAIAVVLNCPLPPLRLAVKPLTSSFQMGVSEGVWAGG